MNNTETNFTILSKTDHRYTIQITLPDTSTKKVITLLRKTGCNLFHERISRLVPTFWTRHKIHWISPNYTKQEILEISQCRTIQEKAKKIVITASQKLAEQISSDEEANHETLLHFPYTLRYQVQCLARKIRKETPQQIFADMFPDALSTPFNHNDELLKELNQLFALNTTYRYSAWTLEKIIKQQGKVGCHQKLRFEPFEDLNPLHPTFETNLQWIVSQITRLQGKKVLLPEKGPSFDSSQGMTEEANSSRSISPSLSESKAETINDLQTQIIALTILEALSKEASRTEEQLETIIQHCTTIWREKFQQIEQEIEKIIQESHLIQGQIMTEADREPLKLHYLHRMISTFTLRPRLSDSLARTILIENTDVETRKFWLAKYQSKIQELKQEQEFICKLENEHKIKETKLQEYECEQSILNLHLKVLSENSKMDPKIKNEKIKKIKESILHIEEQRDEILRDKNLLTIVSKDTNFSLSREHIHYKIQTIQEMIDILEPTLVGRYRRSDYRTFS